MSDKGSDPNAVPWYWHFYRPEALMVYVLIGLGLFFHFRDQPDLNLTRLYPLDNGTAIGIGFDDQDEENPLLQVWLTGIDENSEWIRELEGNFVPPPVGGFDVPIFAHVQQRGFLLVGQDNGVEQRMTGIVCLDLEDGEILWSNYEQPAGDCQFGSVATWDNSLITTHLAARSNGSKMYVVGRNPENGSMIWTKVFDLPAELESPRWQNQIAFLPGSILVETDSLSLLNSANGDLIQSWAGKASSFTGGWIFYQNGAEFHAKEANTLADSLLYTSSDSSNGIDIAPAPGYSGFYDGFPIHFSDRLGLLAIQSPNPTPSKFTASPLSTVYPNGRAGAIINARPGFLDEDWPRYLPIFASLYEDDTLKKYFPETMADRSLAGDRLIVLDLQFQRPALVGEQLLQEPWKGQMTTWQGMHYFIGTDPDQPSTPLVMQFDGGSGALRKAVASTYPFKGLMSAYPHLPIGNRIWVTGDKYWAALSIPDLELQFTTSDSIGFKDVSEEYRELLGYRKAN